ncbi:MurR/RpiR family transcriptional regulator [Pseudothermotoga thermarum]|uniref:Transcriptional regulator, RpiR family n=1 Tax=Pseudothermotoga thermarum DSM 5069 TaxID=688269 RepID=F7YUZ7_9THEM|nr:MurR/RpiR family transcriptional regulator [Pseudothermotoga thermarum]AEH50281.1 transcriptional regulator, RpiR family [Pseudothermotoga thermarum DSM 5069]
MTGQKSLFQVIRDQLPNLSESLRNIATFFIQNPDLVLKMNIVELAKAANVSPSTVFDFAKKLGYSGFRELKIALAQELQLFHSLKLDEEKLSSVAKNFLPFVFENISESFQLIEKESIEKAAKAILKSNVVEILSYGFDSIAGKDLFLKLKQLGFQVNFFDNPFLQSISTSNLPENSCVVAISSSYSSTDMLDAMMFAKKAKATVVAIAPPGSKIAENCDILIPSYVQNELLSEGGILTKYLQLFIVDTLFITLMELEKEKMVQKYKHFEQVLFFKRQRRGDKGVV